MNKKNRKDMKCTIYKLCNNKNWIELSWIYEYNINKYNVYTYIYIYLKVSNI